MKPVDPYSKDPAEFNRLMAELYAKYTDAQLPPEYASMLENNLNSLLFRLARYKFATKMVKRTDRVLEVGCSTGLGTIFMGQHCKSIVGLDVKEDDIARARKMNPRKNVSYEHADLFQYQSPAGKFDSVISLDAIEHMNEADGDRFVGACIRQLKQEGMFLVGTPNWYIREYENAFSRASHIKMYTQDELLSVVDRYCNRTVAFSMTDEIVHTGHPKVAWYHFVLGFGPKC